MPRISAYALMRSLLCLAEPRVMNVIRSRIHRYNLLRLNVNCEMYVNIALPPPIYQLNPSSAFMDADAARVNGYNDRVIIPI